MKSAISVEGDLLNQVPLAALEMGVTPSTPDDTITEQLNRVYAGDTDLSEARTVQLMKAKFRSALKDRW